MVHLPVNSFSPPCPSSGHCGCKVPEPFAPMLLCMLEELSSTQGTGSRVLSTSGCSGFWEVGANAVARTGCVPGPQNTQLAATSSLQGLPMALSLLDVAHSPFALTDPAQRGVAVALLRLQLLCTPECHPPLCPPASPSLPAALPARVGEH